MAEVGVQVFPLDGQNVEWRNWATFAAAVLNLCDLVSVRRVDADIYRQAVDDLIGDIAKELDVLPDTIKAILYALGRKTAQEDVAPQPNMVRGKWPTA